MRKKYIAFIISLVMTVTMLAGCSVQGNTGSAGNSEGETVSAPVTFESMMEQWKRDKKGDTVACWYTDLGDQRWLAERALDFEKEYGIKVELVYYDGAQLFNDINQANQNGVGPDMYIMGNDQLEFAVTGGMAEENTAFDDAFWQDNYPETAKKAFNYKGKQYGYPIYFDTYCLVYDANLLTTAPASIDDILAFLDEYEDTGSTKAVFRWDVADPYIDSMFVASYADIFGENGDDITSFSINGEQEVKAMEYFQSLSAYLWMDKTNISHDTVMNRIKEGTLVLGLCKSDILPVLYEMQGSTSAIQSGDETTNYKVSYVPSLTAELSSTCYSTTYGAFINLYGNNEAGGNMFAMYLAYEDQERQFAGNGKLPVMNQKYHFDEMQTVMYAQYQNSKPVPKTMLLGDYLMESAIAFDAIWGGSNAKEELDKLQGVMEEKLN